MDTSTLLQIVVAESYGGKDEPVDTLVASLVDINVGPIFDPLRVKETPDQAIYQAYEETGTDLAQVRCCSQQLHLPRSRSSLLLWSFKKWSACGKDLCEAATADALGSLPQGEQSSSTRRWKLT